MITVVGIGRRVGRGEVDVGRREDRGPDRGQPRSDAKKGDARRSYARRDQARVSHNRQLDEVDCGGRGLDSHINPTLTSPSSGTAGSIPMLMLARALPEQFLECENVMYDRGKGRPRREEHRDAGRKPLRGRQQTPRSRGVCW